MNFGCFVQTWQNRVFAEKLLGFVPKKKLEHAKIQVSAYPISRPNSQWTDKDRFECVLLVSLLETYARAVSQKICWHENNWFNQYDVHDDDWTAVRRLFHPSEQLNLLVLDQIILGHEDKYDGQEENDSKDSV